MTRTKSTTKAAKSTDTMKNMQRREFDRLQKAERYNLAETIKVTIEAIVEGDEARQFGALLAQCYVSIGISLVSWDDVADHYLQKYRESV